MLASTRLIPNSHQNGSASGWFVSFAMMIETGPALAHSFTNSSIPSKRLDRSCCQKRTEFPPSAQWSPKKDHRGEPRWEKDGVGRHLWSLGHTCRVAVKIEAAPERSSSAIHNSPSSLSPSSESTMIVFRTCPRKMSSAYSNPCRLCKPISYEWNRHGARPGRKEWRICQVGCFEIAEPIEVHGANWRIEIGHVCAIKYAQQSVAEWA